MSRAFWLKPCIVSFALLLGAQANVVVPPTATSLREEWNRYLVEQAGSTATAAGFPYQSCFESASARYGLPVTLLLAVARGESDFDPAAVSHADAVGIMQIRWPLTAKHLGIFRREELFDGCLNIDAGARYLKELLDTYDGDLHLALLAYNRGPARLDRAIDRGTVDGDIWYSSYVADHLRFIVERQSAPGLAAPYADTGRLVIISFAAPFHARGLVEHLSAVAPQLQIDWFRDRRRYDVTLHYENERQRDDGLAVLRKHGITAPQE